jgi:hypothetical protein
MASHSALHDQKIDKPATKFETPSDVVKARDLSHEEKKKALNTWEQDARQLMTASNEGMTGCDEGLTKEDPHQFGQVVRAKDTLGEKPKHKPSQ